MAEAIAGIPLRESLSCGDIFFIGLHPYDIFQRPLSAVAAGARLIATTLGRLSAAGAFSVIWRHPDALHLPWITFGQAMWGTIMSQLPAGATRLQ